MKQNALIQVLETKHSKRSSEEIHVVDDIDVANLDMYHPRTLHGCFCMGTMPVGMHHQRCCNLGFHSALKILDSTGLFIF